MIGMKEVIIGSFTRTFMELKRIKKSDKGADDPVLLVPLWN